MMTGDTNNKKAKKKDKKRKLNDSSSSEDNSQEKCGECGKPEGSNENWINCSKCDLCFHCRCIHIDKKTFETIQKFNQNLNFICNGCLELIKDFGSPLNNDRPNDKMNAKIDSLRNVVFKLLDDFSGFKNVLMNRTEEIVDMKNKSSINPVQDSKLVNLVNFVCVTKDKGSHTVTAVVNYSLSLS